MKEFFIRAAIAADPAFSLGSSGTIVDNAGASAGLANTWDLPTLIGRFISIALGILGLVFVIYVVYAGFLYLTAQGEETNVKKAKKMLSQAVIGLVLIVSAYAITNLVTDALTTVTNDPSADEPASTEPPLGDYESSDSGASA